MYVLLWKLSCGMQQQSYMAPAEYTIYPNKLPSARIKLSIIRTQEENIIAVPLNSHIKDKLDIQGLEVEDMHLLRRLYCNEMSHSLKHRKVYVKVMAKSGCSWESNPLTRLNSYDILPVRPL